MAVSAVNITSNPALLYGWVPVDLFKLRFPTAEEVLNTPGTVNTSRPTLLQASVPADTFASPYLSTTKAAEAQGPAAQGLSAETSATVTATTTASLPALETTQIQTVASEASALTQEVSTPEVTDSMPAMLRGIYLAPVVAHFYIAPYRGGLSASAEEALQDVTAPTPTAPSTEYAHGQPFNPNAQAMHPPTTETREGHLRRITRNAGLPPLAQQIVSGTYGLVVKHTLDVVA